jgi:hypothetical protein
MENVLLMIEDKYEIVSVQPTEPPSDRDGSNWHSYVIMQGSNTIRGYRQGNLNSVRKAVKDLVFQLNERRTGKRGRVHIVMPKTKKPVGKG